MLASTNAPIDQDISSSGQKENNLDGPPSAAIDEELLACKDEDFLQLTWEDVQRIVATNKLEALKRRPSDSLRYLKWSQATKVTHGTITNFVVQKRLHWNPKHAVTEYQPVTATSFDHHSDVPFEDERDYSILKNDWPYGFVPGITHIVVWSRVPIAVDDAEGDVTPTSRALIETFVQKAFVQNIAHKQLVDLETAKSRVLWFKNWVSLQSIRGVDHIHILIRDASEQLLLHWTGDDSRE